MGVVGLCCVHGPIALFKRKEINEKMGGELIYIVMRQEGVNTDGYYYESKTTIMGVRRDREDAGLLLKAITNNHHGDEKPSHGKYDKFGDTEIVYYIGDGLEDKFWIEEEYLF